MFTRKIFPQISKHLSSRQVTVLTGMRRTGKTTLVKALLENIKSDNKIYLDLERIDNRELLAEKNYENIIIALKQQGLDITKKSYIALDEIQLVPNAPSVLKYLYDTYDIKFIVTGSSSFYLRNLFTESLAGRKKIFELYPLTFGEFLIFKNVTHEDAFGFKNNFHPFEYEKLKSYYEEYIEYGGFPEVVLSKKIDQKKDILFDILNSYINIDIKLLADFREHDNVYRLMKILAPRIGNRLDVSKLSRLVGISRPTIQNYLEFLEHTYLIKRVSVVANDPDREIVKAQKLYFLDTGLANILGDLSGGAKFENTVFCQLRHLGQVNYYSLKTGQEIDFILDKKYALEAKEHPVLKDKKQLEILAKRIDIKKSYLVGRYQVPNFDNYLWGGSIG